MNKNILTLTSAIAIFTTVISADETINGALTIDSPTYPGVYFHNNGTPLGAVKADIVQNVISIGDMYSAAPSLAVRFYSNDVERLRISQNGNVGIGTAEPGSRLHVDTAIRISPFTSGKSGSYTDSTAELRLLNGNIYNHQGNSKSKISFGGAYNPSGTSYDATYNYIEWYAGQFYIRNNQQDKIIVGGGDEWGKQDVLINPGAGNVGIRTTSPDHELDVNGTIRAKEVIVETGWSDFVFEDSYELRSLDEVESHIEEHGHLPNVPSAEVVESEGLSVGEAQKIMMQKIEELTLYMIDLKKENELLNKRLAELEAN